jgi:hypothetical protein
MKRTASPVIPDLKKAVVAATGYDSSGIDVSSTAYRIVITVADSKLLQGTSRNSGRRFPRLRPPLQQQLGGSPNLTR